MAQPKESNMMDLARDLELLFPNGDRKVSGLKKGRKLREQGIQELCERNGTLHEVGLGSTGIFRKKMLNYLKIPS